MAQFNVTSPKANQILVYDAISRSFINVESSLGNGVSSAVNLGNNGSSIFHDRTGDTLRFKTIMGGNGITLIDRNAYVEIEFDGDANTLSGFIADDFMKKDNNLSDVNPTSARANIDVFSTDESRDLFMETNASNIPDKDNEYDLGSNGRRYADIYAKTFHGLATQSTLAWQLTRNNATDGQILEWQNSVNRWVPVDPTPITITGAVDLDTSKLKHRSILRYNVHRNKWEPELFEFGGDGGAFSGLQNVGGGFGVYGGRSGLVGNLRTLRSGSGIRMRLNIDEEEIIIESDAARGTDELPEGSDNLYFTDSRADFRISKASISDLIDVDGDNAPTVGQGLVWDGRIYRYRNVAVDIFSSNDIPEGNANQYFTEQRVKDVIDDYIGGGSSGGSGSSGITLTSLSDVTATHTDGNILISDNGKWIDQENTLVNLNDVDITSIVDGDAIMWSDANNAFITYKKPEYVSDLTENSSSLHFNATSFSDMLDTKTSDDIVEGGINKYLTNANLLSLLQNISINELIDVDISSVSNDDVLIWSQVDRKFITKSVSSSTSSGASSIFDLDEVAFDAGTINDREVLMWDGTNSELVGLPVYDRIDTLEDVELTNPSDGDILYFNGSKYVNKESLPYDISNPLPNEVLSWDGDKFINTDLGAMGSISVKLGSLTDVDLDYNLIEDGDAIVWDSASKTFVPSVSADFINIVDINGMDVTGITVDDGIRWDGTNFTPTHIPTFNPTSFSDDDVMAYDTTESAFVTKNKWDILGVNFTVPNDRDLLIFDSASSKFNVGNLSLSDIEGITDATTTKTDGSTYELLWNDTDAQFDIVDIQGFVDNNNQRNDFEVTTPEDLDALVWDGTKFRNYQYAMGDLSNVTITTPSNNDLIMWDSSTTRFVNSDISLDILTDITLSELKDREVLVWDSQNDTFINDYVSVFDLKGMNLDTSTLLKGEYMVWDDVNQEFTNSVNDVGGLADVDLLNLEENHVLYWDNVAEVFKNKELDFSSLSDTSTSNLENRDIIVWDAMGEVFTNGKISIEDLSDVTLPFKIDGQALIYNSVSDSFEMGGVATNLESLPDTFISGTKDGDVLSYISRSDSWVNSSTIRGIQTVSLEKSVYFPDTGSQVDDDFVPGSPFEYEEIWSDIGYHYREITEATTFKIKNRDDKSEVNFIYLDFDNPDNHAIDFKFIIPGEIDYEEGTQAPDQEFDVGYKSDVNWDCRTLVTLYTENNQDWFIFDTINPFGNYLPSIDPSPAVDGGVYIYDTVSETLQNRKITASDVDWNGWVIDNLKYQKNPLPVKL